MMGNQRAAQNQKNPVIILSGLMMTVLIMYIFWFKEAFFDIPLVLYGSVAATFFLVLLDMTGQSPVSLREIPLMIRTLFLFGIYALTTGLFVAIDKNQLLSDVITFFAFTAVCFFCWYICHRGNSEEWFFNALYLTGILCAVQTIFYGQDYYNIVVVTTMSSHNNPNSLGVVMVTGIFALLVKYYRSRKHLIVHTFFLLVFLYVIILTGSRKSLFAGVFLGITGILIYLKDLFDRKQAGRLLASFAVLAVGFAGIIRFLTDKYAGSASFERMILLFSEGGTSERIGLYQSALELWMKNPITGVGFNQYYLYNPSGLYSHSSYAEVLSCQGILGFLIFFIPLLVICRKIVENLIKCDSAIKTAAKVMVGMLAVELFLGAGQIFIYDLTHMLTLSCLSWEAAGSSATKYRLRKERYD